MSWKIALHVASLVCLGASLSTVADENISLTGMPDYTWYAGCFGAASGNIMGYWDRHGFPSFYTGPTADGFAPLDSNGANAGIRSLWASKAGFDGRPADKLGHIDDYWDYYINEFAYSYESAATDPYVLAGRPDHEPECVSDFMGSSQNKWSDFDGECSGNIDAFSFNFWDKEGNRRNNFTPPNLNGNEVRDIQSGWRRWAESRGNHADVVSQLVDFNPNTPAGKGFTFEDLKAEINAGYPVMLFLQNPNEFSRSLPGNSRANPHVHGMIAYGYITTDDGQQIVRYRTSWGSGDGAGAPWGPAAFEAGLSLRGVIGFHPLPQIKTVTPTANGLNIKWDGPSSTLLDNNSGAETQVHWYVIEKSNSLAAAGFVAVTDPSTDLESTVPTPTEAQTFYRVRLVPSPQQ